MVRGIVLLCFLSFALVLQGGDLRKVMKAYDKGDWVKTEETIRKALDTQPVHPGVRYYYSLVYARPDFPRSNLDSARIFIRQSLADLDHASEEIQAEFVAEGLSSETLEAHLRFIAERWYTQSYAIMTIAEWQHYIQLFPDLPYVQTAIHARDSLAFQVAVGTMSVSGWHLFLENYPASSFSERARFKRDSLQLLDFTKTNSVADLERFIRENPTSTYVSEALMHLFKIQTIAADPRDYIGFISQYARYPAAQTAINRLYHIDRENQFELLDQYADYHSKSDSLLASVRQTVARYFPVFRNGYTMMAFGQEPVALAFDELQDELLCEGWTTDLIGGSVKGVPLLISKSGRQIAEGKLLRDLGFGLLLIERADQKFIMHKSGGEIVSEVEDAAILGGRLLKVKKGKWGIHSLMGLPLTSYRYDDIFTDGHFWFFERDGLLATPTFDQIVQSFPEGLFLEFKFEDYEMITPDLIVGFREDRECLLRSDGTFQVAWGQHHIYPGDSTGYIRESLGYALYGQQRYDYFPYLEANSGFVLRKEVTNTWRLISAGNQWEKTFSDSLKLLNRHAAIIAGSQPRLLFQNEVEYSLAATDQPTVFTPGAPFILINGTVKTVLGANGRKLFAGNYDAIRLEGDSLFVVTFRGKHGLISSKGKELLPLQFDYIDFSDGIASTLKKGKIGGYDLRSKVAFDAIYESKPGRLGDHYLLTKNGKKGLLGADHQVVLPFEYDAIQWWTEHEVWVRQSDQYFLMDLETKEVQLEVASMEILVSDGSLLKCYGTGGFGVLSSQKGLLIPFGFTAIRMMGSDAEAIIVAEQTLPEAGFHVITYYTRDGKKIYAHAYRSEDYEKVFCDD